MFNLNSTGARYLHIQKHITPVIRNLIHYYDKRFMHDSCPEHNLLVIGEIFQEFFDNRLIAGDYVLWSVRSPMSNSLAF